jgi:GT2 family glycosyltransferase
MLHRKRSATVVAIPAQNEADVIGPCLAALDAQIEIRPDHIVLLANNCTDMTVSLARAKRMRPGTTLHVIEMHLPAAQSNTGHARRLAMQCAAALAGTDGILLTTDADGRVEPDWIAANLAALARGADVVCGWIELDPTDRTRIPLELRADNAQESAYDLLCDTIHARLDPDPSDPLPRHTQNCGATIALTAPVFARCGGVPDIAYGEDRALINALRRVDARIRHAPEVKATMSGRMVGRNYVGTAATILRRLSGPDPYLDDRLEPAMDCARRAASRRRLREVFKTGEGAPELALQLDFDLPRLRGLLKMTFGAAWYELEAESPILRRRLVALADVIAESTIAASILAACDRAGQFDRLGLWMPNPAALREDGRLL